MSLRRPIPREQVGRFRKFGRLQKNWSIFGSRRGGAVAGRLYSLVMSCKLGGMHPEAYIEDVLGLVTTTPESRIADLTPWGWAACRTAEDVEVRDA